MPTMRGRERAHERWMRRKEPTMKPARRKKGKPLHSAWTFICALLGIGLAGIGIGSVESNIAASAILMLMGLIFILAMMYLQDKK